MSHATFSYLPDMLAVELHTMDADHERLFAQLDVVKQHCMDTDVLPAVEAEKLYTVLVEHCALEKSLACSAGINFDQHDIKHSNMLATIRKMIDSVMAGHGDVFSMLRYVDYWFERHIVDEDRALAASLRGFDPAGFAEAPRLSPQIVGGVA